ncbi:MAG: hypothetical protein FWG84_01780 [Bacteroidales bacterium]|nr:hypothetical protein [Bacteroidales bacterium]
MFVFRGWGVLTAQNKLGRILYTVVKTKTEYDESLLKTNENERLKKRLNKIRKEMEKIENQLDERA